MERTSPIASPSWHAGATVFSAQALDGTEALLWLVPQVDLDSLRDPLTPPHREVRYQSMRLTSDEKITALPLIPTWWVFEPTCLPADCICGSRSLTEVLALLPRRLAGQALAAHIDLTEALIYHLSHSPSTPASHELRLALDAMVRELEPLGAPLPTHAA